jgi:holliday junction DNA helicase RuvB
LVIGEGPSARSIRIDLSPFTLVGATTRAGLLSTPLRDRFGIVSRLDFYSVADLELILTRAALKLGAPLTPDGASEIARRARGTPRIAVRLLRRVRDFADALGTPLDAGAAANGLARLDIDPDGLDMLDRRYLKALVETYGGGPVGVETLAAAISEARDGVEDVIEPRLYHAHTARSCCSGASLQFVWFA